MKYNRLPRYAVDVKSSGGEISKVYLGTRVGLSDYLKNNCQGLFVTVREQTKDKDVRVLIFSGYVSEYTCILGGV